MASKKGCCHVPLASLCIFETPSCEHEGVLPNAILQYTHLRDAVMSSENCCCSVSSPHSCGFERVCCTCAASRSTLFIRNPRVALLGSSSFGSSTSSLWLPSSSSSSLSTALSISLSSEDMMLKPQTLAPWRCADQGTSLEAVYVMLRPRPKHQAEPNERGGYAAVTKENTINAAVYQHATTVSNPCSVCAS